MIASDYCRQIESYLCRKNDGHLVRIVGPSFDLVSKWLAAGVPFKVACEGIDRYFDRYYRKGPRRRPVRIDFCEADVLDVFDEWRRATGLVAVADSGDSDDRPGGRGTSLPEHLKRVLERLTNARATGRVGVEVDPLIDAVACELDTARHRAGGLRGDVRAQLIERLAALDTDLMAVARAAVDAVARSQIDQEVEQEFIGFRDQMAPERLAHAKSLAADRLVRAQLGLPVVSYR